MGTRRLKIRHKMDWEHLVDDRFFVFKHYYPSSELSVRQNNLFSFTASRPFNLRVGINFRLPYAGLLLRVLIDGARSFRRRMMLGRSVEILKMHFCGSLP